MAFSYLVGKNHVQIVNNANVVAISRTQLEEIYLEMKKNNEEDAKNI